MPTVRIDDAVWGWLQSLARPFEDTPNSVLRRVAKLDSETEKNGGVDPSSGEADSQNAHGYIRSATVSTASRLTGRELSKRWQVPVRHALYHEHGMFYENLREFPGALFDPDGYVIFETDVDYRRSQYLRIGQKLNVPGGIASIPGYRRVNGAKRGSDNTSRAVQK